MKKRIITPWIWLLLPLWALLTNSCKNQDNIIFDSELPRFELRADRILLEVIVPSTTPPDDRLFIVGAFNGGLEKAVNHVEWQLEKAHNYAYKYGIYLDPSTFQSGHSLADGFYIYSVSQQEERSLTGESLLHTDSPVLGTRTNITVRRWASYFTESEEPAEEKHDGYVIYVKDNTGYPELAMYAYGDAEAFGGWPGMRSTGTLTKDGQTYTYFDTGVDNQGLSLNLIFNNNNNGKQLGDFAVTLNRDYYLELTADGVKESTDNTAVEIKHDGYAIFIEDQSGWDDLTIYAWSDKLPELFGAWPGGHSTGKTVINGITYQYFDTGTANEGLQYNLIMNNNNGGKQFDLAGVTLNRHYYFSITNSQGIEIDPETYTGK